MSSHFTSCHVMSRHVTSCHVMPRDVPHVTSCHVMSYHVMSRHVTSRHVTSCPVMSRHVISCYVISRRKSRDSHATNASLSTDFFHTQSIQIKHDRVRWLSRRLPIQYRISGIWSSFNMNFGYNTVNMVEAWLPLLTFPAYKTLIITLFCYNTDILWNPKSVL